MRGRGGEIVGWTQYLLHARLDFDSVLVIEPCAVDKNFASTYCISDHCYKCRAEYWLTEVE